MKVGDLVTMPGTFQPARGIVLQVGESPHRRNVSHHTRAKVYWIEDAEASWEPKKWLEVISAASR